MGAKFIHPMESEGLKNPVAMRNTTAAIIRRSAGIISQNLSASCDMQSAFAIARLYEARGQLCKHINAALRTAKRLRHYLAAAANALLSRALRRLAAFL